MFRLVFLVVFLHVVAQDWHQIGPDIDGEACSGIFGSSVALSANGRRIAVGAMGYGPSSDHPSGQVRIFEQVDEGWSQLGGSLDGEADGDFLGVSVAMNADGTLVAIGAYGNNGAGWSAGPSAGHVRVYAYGPEQQWRQLGNDLDGDGSHDMFGSKVALSSDGSTLAVYAQVGSNSEGRGRVRVYIVSDGNGRWMQTGGSLHGEADNDRFGSALALSANGLVVAAGALHHDDSGHVRVFGWHGQWKQMGSTLEAEAAGDHFGESLALSADGLRIAVGAPMNDGNGHVRVYTYTNNEWLQMGKDLEGESAGGWFGKQVALSADGSRVAVGGTSNDVDIVRIYSFDGSEWKPIGLDVEGDPARTSYDEAVTLSADGSRVAIGSGYHEGYRGRARIFELSADGSRVAIGSGSRDFARGGSHDCGLEMRHAEAALSTRGNPSAADSSEPKMPLDLAAGSIISAGAVYFLVACMTLLLV